MIARGENNAVHSLVLSAAAKRPGRFFLKRRRQESFLKTSQLSSNTHNANRNRGERQRVALRLEKPRAQIPRGALTFRNAPSAGIEIKLH
jgi:hypothetical protein